VWFGLSWLWSPWCWVLLGDLCLGCVVGVRVWFRTGDGQGRYRTPAGSAGEHTNEQPNNHSVVL